MTIRDVWDRLAAMVGCGGTYRAAVPAGEVVKLMNEIAGRVTAEQWAACPSAAATGRAGGEGEALVSLGDHTFAVAPETGGTCIGISCRGFGADAAGLIRSGRLRLVVDGPLGEPALFLGPPGEAASPAPEPLHSWRDRAPLL